MIFKKNIAFVAIILFMMNSHVCFSMKNNEGLSGWKKGFLSNQKRDEKKEDLISEKGLLTQNQLHLRAQYFLKMIGYKGFSQDERGRLGIFLNDRITYATEILKETCKKDILIVELQVLRLHERSLSDALEMARGLDSEVLKLAYVTWRYSCIVSNNLVAGNYKALGCWTKHDKDKFSAEKDDWGCLADCFSVNYEVVSGEEFEQRNIQKFGIDGLKKRHLIESKLFAQAVLEEINKEKKDEKIM